MTLLLTKYFISCLFFSSVAITFLQKEGPKKLLFKTFVQKKNEISQELITVMYYSIKIQKSQSVKMIFIVMKIIRLFGGIPVFLTIFTPSSLKNNLCKIRVLILLISS